MVHEQSAHARQFLRGADIHTRWESDYLNRDMDRFYNLAFDEIAKQLNLKPSDTLLDAGCGYCYHTTRLARTGARITAVDFSDAALEAGRQALIASGLDKQVTLQNADLTNLPFDDSTFDAIVSWGVLMHIPELETALCELVRVLKPGGRLVLCENNAHSLDVMVRERAIRIIKTRLGRKQPEIKKTHRGVEEWADMGSGGLMVRKTDMTFLTDFLAQRNVRLVKRSAGQLTEAYTNMPFRALKRLIYALNIFYFRFVRLPQPAIGNILYFEKLQPQQV